MFNVSKILEFCLTLFNSFSDQNSRSDSPGIYPQPQPSYPPSRFDPELEPFDADDSFIHRVDDDRNSTSVVDSAPVEVVPASVGDDERTICEICSRFG